jgi:putative nucleotidyltransferase with HDIG domain
MRHEGQPLWVPAAGSALDAGRQDTVRLSDVLTGLSYALDLTEGSRPGHSVRTCLIGMRLAEVIGLPQEHRSSLFYALLMKDLGCSSNAARFAALFGADDHQLKSSLKTVDWPKALESFRWVASSVSPGASWLTRVWRFLAVMARGPKGARDVVLTRCERGADIARVLGLSTETSEAIRALDEHWNGRGQPYGLKGERIPQLARILGLAQTVEIFSSTYGVPQAFDMAAARRGRWFEPDLVNALLSTRGEAAFWHRLGDGHDIHRLRSVEPPDKMLNVTEDRLDVIADAFAMVIDAKSPWTFRHSAGVADISTAIARELGFSGAERRELRRAALLHDVGKLGISNLILDKPGRLTDEEFAIIKRHPAHTAEILQHATCFSKLTDVAASHHERLDGNGYHRGRGATLLTLPARVICVADICDALRSSRPYRPGLPVEKVLDIMGREVGAGLDADCYVALKQVLQAGMVADQIEVPAATLVPALSEDYIQAA